MTYYTPRNIQRLIDPAMGTAGFLLDVATGAGKSSKMLELIGNPPYSSDKPSMADPWADAELQSKRETIYRLKQALVSTYLQAAKGDLEAAATTATEAIRKERQS